MHSRAVHIRPFAPPDRARLIELMIELQAFERQFDADYAAADEAFGAWYIDRLLRELEERRGVLLVAVDDDVPCGFAAGFPEEHAEAQSWCFYIAELVVSESRRSRGTGTQLVRAMEEIARARGLAAIVIGVLAGSTRVHRLYQRLGFRDYAIRLKKML